MSDPASRLDSLFGDPEDDPLLENDPLSDAGADASSDPASPDSSSDADAAPFAFPDSDPIQDADSVDADSSQQTSSEPSSSHGASDAPASDESIDALLGLGPPSESPSDADDERRLLISRQAAADGRLAPLTVALKRGWSLCRITLADRDDAPAPFVFVLHPPQDRS